MRGHGVERRQPREPSRQVRRLGVSVIPSVTGEGPDAGSLSKFSAVPPVHGLAMGPPPISLSSASLRPRRAS